MGNLVMAIWRPRRIRALFQCEQPLRLAGWRARPRIAATTMRRHFWWGKRPADTAPGFFHTLGWTPETDLVVVAAAKDDVDSTCWSVSAKRSGWSRRARAGPSLRSRMLSRAA